MYIYCTRGKNCVRRVTVLNKIKDLAVKSPLPRKHEQSRIIIINYHIHLYRHQSHLLVYLFSPVWRDQTFFASVTNRKFASVTGIGLSTKIQKCDIAPFQVCTEGWRGRHFRHFPTSKKIHLSLFLHLHFTSLNRFPPPPLKFKILPPPHTHLFALQVPEKCKGGGGRY